MNRHLIHFISHVIYYIWICTASSGELLNYISTPEYSPTPTENIDIILKELNPKPDEVFVDYGCGDGRVVIAAARDYGCKAVGVEINPLTANLARRNVEQAGLEDRVEIITGDATSVDVEADVGFVYLFKDTLGELRNKLLQLDRFASYMHQVPNLPMWKYSDYYIWNYNNVLGAYQGKTYTARQCNSSNCIMCNRISESINEQKQYRLAIINNESNSENDSQVQYVWKKFCNGRKCWWELVPK